MKRELGIILLAFIATVGFSGAAAAQPFQGPTGGTFIGHHPGTNVVIINRNVFFRHHFFNPFFFRHRFFFNPFFFRHRFFNPFFFRHHFFNPFFFRHRFF